MSERCPCCGWPPSDEATGRALDAARERIAELERALDLDAEQRVYLLWENDGVLGVFWKRDDPALMFAEAQSQP